MIKPFILKVNAANLHLQCKNTIRQNNFKHKKDLCESP